jgi:hypothetical protein
MSGDNDSTHHSEGSTGATDLDPIHALGSLGDGSGRRVERLIEWNVDTFIGVIKCIVARRLAIEVGSRSFNVTGE